MIKINLKRIFTENAHVVSLFFFQYSLVMILTKYVSPTILVTITSLILTIISVYINAFRIRYSQCFCIFVAIMSALSIKCIVDGTLYPLILYIEVTTPVLFIIANGFDFNKFINFSCKLAYLNFISIFLYPFMGPFSYMRFGYGMLLSTSFLYIKSFSSKSEYNIFDLILLFISFIMMFFYGSRGAIFSFLMLITIDRIFIKRKDTIKNIIVFLILCIFLYKFEQILTFLQTCAARIGVRTYSLSKLRMQLDSGAEAASSGRFYIYRDTITTIQDNWLFGVNMNLDENSGSYAHNLLLQAGLDFGFLGIIIMFMFIFLILIQIWRNSKNYEKCYTLSVLYSVAIGRLMFSSIIWRRPEFWMLLFTSLIISTDKNHKKWRLTYD